MIGTDAIEYASKLKWSIFPVEPREKKPYPTGGRKENGEPFRLRWGKCATNDLRMIRQWWRQWPNANIGLACKHSGLIIIDADEEGAEGWAKFEAIHHLPVTVTQITPRNGKHIIYRAIDGITIGNHDLMNGVNVRGIKGDGGYVVIAPSIHPNGKRYEWAGGLSPYETEIAVIPQALIDALKKTELPPTPAPIIRVIGDAVAQRVFEWKVKDVQIAPQGHKHNVLNTSAYILGQYIGNGLLPEHDVRQALLSAAIANQHRSAEAERVINDAIAAGKSNSRELRLPSRTDSRMNQIRSAVNHGR